MQNLDASLSGFNEFNGSTLRCVCFSVRNDCKKSFGRFKGLKVLLGLNTFQGKEEMWPRWYNDKNYNKVISVLLFGTSLFKAVFNIVESFWH